MHCPRYCELYTPRNAISEDQPTTSAFEDGTDTSISRDFREVYVDVDLLEVRTPMPTMPFITLIKMGPPQGPSAPALLPSLERAVNRPPPSPSDSRVSDRGRGERPAGSAPLARLAEVLSATHRVVRVPQLLVCSGPHLVRIGPGNPGVVVRFAGQLEHCVQ